jgi:hypothetical protein
MDELVDPVLQPPDRVRVLLRPVVLALWAVVEAGRARAPRSLRGLWSLWGLRRMCGPGGVVVPAGPAVFVDVGQGPGLVDGFLRAVGSLLGLFG